MRIICISGKAQHGKDTAASLLREELENRGYRVLVIHYADLLKHICRAFFEWDGKKDATGRWLLQFVGTDVIRSQKPDFWVDHVISVLELFPNEWDYVLIPDCRFPNEIDRLQKGGFRVDTLRIVRPGYLSSLTPEQQAHPSETALDDYSFSSVIYNDGTMESLRRKLVCWYEVEYEKADYPG